MVVRLRARRGWGHRDITRRSPRCASATTRSGSRPSPPDARKQSAPSLPRSKDGRTQMGQQHNRAPGVRGAHPADITPTDDQGQEWPAVAQPRPGARSSSHGTARQRGTVVSRGQEPALQRALDFDPKRQRESGLPLRVLARAGRCPGTRAAAPGTASRSRIPCEWFVAQAETGSARSGERAERCVP
jgi:hypothetical protein